MQRQGWEIIWKDFIKVQRKKTHVLHKWNALNEFWTVLHWTIAEIPENQKPSKQQPTTNCTTSDSNYDIEQQHMSHARKTIETIWVRETALNWKIREKGLRDSGANIRIELDLVGKSRFCSLSFLLILHLALSFLLFCDFCFVFFPARIYTYESRAHTDTRSPLTALHNIDKRSRHILVILNTEWKTYMNLPFDWFWSLPLACLLGWIFLYLCILHMLWNFFLVWSVRYLPRDSFIIHHWRTHNFFIHQWIIYKVNMHQTTQTNSHYDTWWNCSWNIGNRQLGRPIYTPRTFILYAWRDYNVRVIYSITHIQMWWICQLVDWFASSFVVHFDILMRKRNIFITTHTFFSIDRWPLIVCRSRPKVLSLVQITSLLLHQNKIIEIWKIDHEIVLCSQRSVFLCD